MRKTYWMIHGSGTVVEVVKKNGEFCHFRNGKIGYRAGWGYVDDRTGLGGIYSTKEYAIEELIKVKRKEIEDFKEIIVKKENEIKTLENKPERTEI